MLFFFFFFFFFFFGGFFFVFFFFFFWFIFLEGFFKIESLVAAAMAVGKATGDYRLIA